MRLAPNVYRSFRIILSTTLFLTNHLFGHSQSSAREWHYPNQRNPLIAIWDASSVTINSWDRDEVSIRAEVLSSVVKPDEVLVKRDNHRLEVSCSPGKQRRRIF